MLRTRAIFLLLLGPAFAVTVASAATTPTETPSILTLEKRATALPNGLRVFLVKYPTPGVIAYQLPVRVGSRNEVDKGRTGFAHFFEHLMFRGTKERSGKELTTLYTKLGVENNAWTDSDITNYHGVVTTAYLPQILAAEADRFQNLAFDEKLFKDEAGAVLGEYHKSVAQPEFLLEEKLALTAYKKHPYSHTTMGFKEDILAYPTRYQDVWPFFRRYYRPENMSVVLVGDVDFDRDTKLIEQLFGQWKGQPFDSVSIPEEPKQKEARRVDIAYPQPTQTRIVVAYKVPRFSTGNHDSAAAHLAAELAFSQVSEFQKKYKFQNGWVDSVDVSAPMNFDPGLWSVRLRLAQAGEGKEKTLLDAVQNTIAGLRNAPPSNQRMLAARKRVRNSALTSWFASPVALSGNIAWFVSFEPDLGVLDRVLANTDAVEPKELQEFAKTYFVDSQKTVAVLRGTK